MPSGNAIHTRVRMCPKCKRLDAVDYSRWFRATFYCGWCRIHFNRDGSLHDVHDGRD